MPSEAQKRASKKWKANRDTITIRPDKETGASIRASAAASDQSVTQYILDRVIPGNMAALSESGPDSLDLDMAKITAHTEKTGETVPTFVNRAVQDTIDRDNQLFKLGMKPKTEETT